MEFTYLSESVNIKKISETGTDGIFEIKGLYNGYGLTLGNALRRTLFSSLPGAAITQIKIKGVDHEFSVIPNVIEDVVEICLNIKKIRFKLFADEAQTITLKVKGEKKVLAGDIETSSQIEVITPDVHIATLSSKSANLEIEFKVEKGLGYIPTEARKLDKLPIGTIALDALFSPIINVNFAVENMRIGDRTDYNNLRIDIKTDGSITPSSSLRKASNILKDHFDKISKLEVLEVVSTEKKAGKKKVTKKKVIKKKVIKKKAKK